MKVKFLEDTRLAGDRLYSKGEEVEFDEDKSKELINRGHAEKLKEQDPLKAKLEDMTKDEISEEFDVSTNQTKDEMIEEALDDNEVVL